MLHGANSKSLTQANISKKYKRSQKTMASEQAIANEAIAKAVVEATKAPVKAMVAATAERPQSVAGPKIGGPAIKQPSFNQEADGKYSKLKNFSLNNNI